VIGRIRDLLLLPAGAIVLALITGGVVMILTSPLVTGGLDLMLPFQAYAALLEGAFLSLNGWIDTFVRATPLMLAGLSVGICFKAGLFNIGAQGQFLMGGLAAGWAGATLATSDPIVAIPLGLLAGMLAGAAYGFIPGWLKAYTGAHEVVTTIMLNYVALLIVSWAILGPIRDLGASFARSPDVGDASLPSLLGPTGHELHAGVLLALLAIPIAWWVLFRSTIGFEVRTVGSNPDAARYAGMRPRLVVTATLTVGGLLAGLGGATEILGVEGYIPATYSTNVGFEAITVALLGRAHPIGIFFSALLIGAFRAGAPLMQVKAGVPVQMIDILQGVILFFLAADLIVRRVFHLRKVSGGVEELQTVTRTYGGQTTAP
jgi:simple sugar transport system permease protein